MRYLTNRSNVTVMLQSNKKLIILNSRIIVSNTISFKTEKRNARAS